MTSRDTTDAGAPEAAAAPEAAPAPGTAPALGPAGTIAAFYQALFGLADWGDAPPPASYVSGPVPKAAGSLAARRLAHPEARFFYAAMMAEVMLLPIMVAHDADERDRLNAEIALILGLGEAVERGWISGYVVCWSQGAYPRAPGAIRVRTAPGRRTREQVLGGLEPQIRRFLARARGAHME